LTKIQTGNLLVFFAIYLNFLKSWEFFSIVHNKWHGQGKIFYTLRLKEAQVDQNGSKLIFNALFMSDQPKIDDIKM
jgi:hypothetical protein